jgi:hypothetical protein
MTPLNKTVKRLSGALVRDRSKFRKLIVSLHPGDFIGLRMQGCRQLETFPMTHFIASRSKLVLRERKPKTKRREGRNKSIGPRW